MAGLFDELRRRNVFKVGAAYLIAAWLLLQVSDLLVPLLSLPNWSTRLVFLLLVIGFIPALILAWAFEITPQGITRDSQSERPASASNSASNKLQPILSGVMLLVIVGIAVAWFAGRDARWARDVAFPQIEQHATAGQWEEAYALAKRVEVALPESETLASLWESFAFNTSIPSEPAGATAYRRAYTDIDGPWEAMGTTPIYDTHIPLGLSLLRLEIEGHSPLLRIIGGETIGTSDLPPADEPGTYFPQLRPGAFLFDSIDSLPAYMVRVPGQPIQIDGATLGIRDFYLGQFEVTNREYKKFIDAGGYARRDLWEHDFVIGEVAISWEDAMKRFVDQTGRPGPSTWEAGNYPDDESEHPVAGVSWFEAAAYARFAGYELPTLHHWRRAFASGLLAWFLPASNLEANGTAPVGQYQGIGWTGTYDMVGNVREWCFNAVEADRVILGAGWNDDPYQVLQTVTDPGHADPFDRSPTNGFRLAKTNDEQNVSRNLRAAVISAEEVSIAEPVSDEVFAAYASLFEYDEGPLNADVEEELTERHWTRERITFTSGSGEDRVPLYLFMPTNGPSRHQVVLYWPTIVALIFDSVDQLSVSLDFALMNGRAVALPILDGTFERRASSFPNWGTVSGRDLVIRQVRDLRRTIDYLETRDDIDADAVALYGFSWGGRLGPLAAAVEPRIKVLVLNQAGLQHLLQPETSVVNYLPRVNVPVLQFNGRYDTDFVFETSAKPFFDLIGTPVEDKKHIVEPTGHFVPRAVVVGETLDWLDKYLGPVNR